MMERREYSPASVAAKVESSTCSLELLPTPRRKKNKNKNKKRFSDEQIRSLESMFESETKLEPRKKVQLARELELQPRQVAIWFQNRRARWKSKQIEHDYKILKANYDNLTSKFESLKKEKQSLLIQLHKLNDLLEKPHCGSMGSEGLAGNSTDGGSDNGDTNCEFEAKLSCLKEGLDHRSVFMCSDDDKSRNIRYFGQEEGTDQLLNTGERVDGPLASPEKWCSSLDSAVLFDQSCSSSQYWWDFWT